MPVSSKSLFHYTTNGFRGLTSILKDGFKVSLCTEAKTSDMGNNTIMTEKLAVPMVCFCDIPLSLVSTHAKMYSSKKGEVYAIGMKKEWGIRYGLNPIIYIPENSNIGFHIPWLRKVFENMLETRKHTENLIADNHCSSKTDNFNLINLKTATAHGENLVNLMSFKCHLMIDQTVVSIPVPYLYLFYKPFIDTYFRGIKIIHDYNFYDEREWRYVPLKLNPIHISVKPDVSIEEIARKNGQDAAELYSKAEIFFRASTEQHIYPNLNFGPDDVTFIIVPNNKSIPKMINFINSKLNDSETNKQAYISKIISYKTIKEDIFSH